jgi:initiation factor 1A
MPNQTGGKNYKKSKHSGGSQKPTMIDRQPDQQYARVIKNLGNCNLLVYCNDNKVRISHIRGALRKRCPIHVGDILLVSLRDFETYAPGERERSDIVAKYSADLLSKLRKQEDINPKLFLALEERDPSSQASQRGLPPEDEGDLFDESAGEVLGDEESVEDDEEDVDIDAI